MSTVHLTVVLLIHIFVVKQLGIRIAKKFCYIPGVSVTAEETEGTSLDTIKN